MTKDFGYLEIYLNSLLQDIYEQPPDDGHTQMALEAFNNWIPQVVGIKNVLDIGCGKTAFMEPYFTEQGIHYTGITFGREAVEAKKTGRNVVNMDMNFLDFPDGSFDLIWARHVAEHSPMPLLTLMEWHRVCTMFLCLIVPNPDHYGRTGRNHYSVLYVDQWKFLMERAGFHVIWEDYSNTTEFRFMAEKKRNS